MWKESSIFKVSKIRGLIFLLIFMAAIVHTLYGWSTLHCVNHRERKLLFVV